MLVLVTLTKVQKHEELLLDYGILRDTIYFEFLRREGLQHNDVSELEFQDFLVARYGHWLSSAGFGNDTCPEENPVFLDVLAPEYINET